MYVPEKERELVVRAIVGECLRDDGLVVFEETDFTTVPARLDASKFLALDRAVGLLREMLIREGWVCCFIICCLLFVVEFIYPPRRRAAHGFSVAQAARDLWSPIR